MISGPTTQTILLNCARELTNKVSPHVDDPSGKVVIAMLDHVLRNAAERSAHEIQWMIQERQDILELAASVIASDFNSAKFESAVADAAPPITLNLDDVVASYRRASEVLSIMLEATILSPESEIHHRALELLSQRVRREKQITLGWGEAEGLGATR